MDFGSKQRSRTHQSCSDLLYLFFSTLIWSMNKQIVPIHHRMKSLSNILLQRGGILILLFVRPFDTSLFTPRPNEKCGFFFIFWMHATYIDLMKYIYPNCDSERVPFRF